PCRSVPRMRPVARLATMARFGLTWLIVLVAVPLAGTQVDQPPPSWSGRTIFTLIFKFHGCTPLQSRDRIFEDPAQTMVIFLGRSAVLEERFDQIRAFLLRGGAVLLASDSRFPEHSKHLARLSGFRIQGTQVTAPASSEAAYRGLEYCPLIKNLLD